MCTTRFTLGVLGQGLRSLANGDWKPGQPHPWWWEPSASRALAPSPGSLLATRVWAASARQLDVSGLPSVGP